MIELSCNECNWKRLVTVFDNKDELEQDHNRETGHNSFHVKQSTRYTISLG